MSRHAALLAPALPGAVRTLFLRALLAPQEAAAAWRQWRSHHPSLLDVLGQERTDALAALLPLLHRAAEKSGLELAQSEATRLRTAVLREQLRARAYADVFVRALDALEAASIHAVVLGGRPLAEQLYEDPALHHTGPIDLLVQERELETAAAALVAAGFQDLGGTGGAPWMRRRLQDRSALVATLGTTVLAHPYYAIDAGQLRAACALADVAGRRVLVPAPHHQLAAMCARGIWTGARRSMLWLVDAALLVRTAGVDDAALRACLRSGHLMLPAGAVLSYLHHDLGVTVPAGLLAACVADAVTDLDRQLALAAAAAASDTALFELVSAAARSGSVGALVRWALHPDPIVAQWETGSIACRSSVTNALQRPMGFVWRRIRGLPHLLQ